MPKAVTDADLSAFTVSVHPVGQALIPSAEVSRTAIAILDVLRQQYQVSIGQTQYRDTDTGELLWLLDAIAKGGESWCVHHADYYLACCELATLVGMDLEDG